MSESTHLFVIPTDRPCAESLESYREEIRRLAREKRVQVLVLEDRPLPAEASAAHRQTVASIVDDVGCQGLVVANDTWAALAEAESWPDYASPLLCGDSLNYGRAFNRVALIGHALDAVVIHRRDSDTGMPEEFVTWDIFPVDYELAGLKSGCDVAGGNYWGNWNVAVAPFLGDAERLRLMLSAHGVPPIGQDSIISEQIPGAAKPPTRDPGGVTHGAYPDLGNCAFRSSPAIAFPAPLTPDTIGTDYLFLALAVGWGRGWLHRLSVRHHHSNERESATYLAEYWLRRARQMDFLLVLRSLQSESADLGDYGQHREILCDALAPLNDTLEQLEPVRRVYWAAYVEAFHETELDRSAGVSDLLRAQEATVHEQNDVSVADYASLLADWRDISARLINGLRELLPPRTIA